MKCLIVSGDYIIESLLNKIIADHFKEFSLDICRSYSEIIDPKGFDVVLVNEKIIGTTGHEVIDLFRHKYYFKGRIIFIGMSDSECIKAIECGADDFLNKPVSIIKLVAFMGNYA